MIDPKKLPKTWKQSMDLFLEWVPMGSFLELVRTGCLSEKYTVLCTL